MPIEPDDVRIAFELILGRPAEPGAVEYFTPIANSLQEFSTSLILSQEFMNRYSMLRADERQGSPFLQRKIVFLHIQKTGGTALARALADCVGHDAVFPDNFRLSHHSARQLASHRLFHGHFSFDEAQYIPGDRFILTVLRKPRERLVSLYRYYRARRFDTMTIAPDALMHAAKLPFADFLATQVVRAHPRINNGQTRTLLGMTPSIGAQLGLHDAAQSDSFDLDSLSRAQMLDVALINLRRLDLVGFTETLDQTIADLRAALAIDAAIALKRLMVTDQLWRDEPESYTRVDAITVGPREQQMMDELVELDEELYEQARALHPARPSPRGAEGSDSLFAQLRAFAQRHLARHSAGAG